MSWNPFLVNITKMTMFNSILTILLTYIEAKNKIQCNLRSSSWNFKNPKVDNMSKLGKRKLEQHNHIVRERSHVLEYTTAENKVTFALHFYANVNNWRVYESIKVKYRSATAQWSTKIASPADKPDLDNRMLEVIYITNVSCID